MKHSLFLPWGHVEFDDGEIVSVLEAARIGLADEDIAITVMDITALTWDELVSLHDKLVKILEHNK